MRLSKVIMKKHHACDLNQTWYNNILYIYTIYTLYMVTLYNKVHLLMIS